jgi:hypothetical protein
MLPTVLEKCNVVDLKKGVVRKDVKILIRDRLIADISADRVKSEGSMILKTGLYFLV